MIRVIKKPKTTTQITSAMTWWLTKRRVFQLDQYEISLLHIDHERNSVKILIKNTLTGSEEVSDELLEEEREEEV